MEADNQQDVAFAYEYAAKCFYNVFTSSCGYKNEKDEAVAEWKDSPEGSKKPWFAMVRYAVLQGMNV